MRAGASRATALVEDARLSHFAAWGQLLCCVLNCADSLHGDPLFEATLDARQNSDASRWRIVGSPITVSLDAVRDAKLISELKL